MEVDAPNIVSLIDALCGIPDASSQQYTSKLQEAVNLLTIGKVTLLEWVADMGDYITSIDDTIRTRATRLLANLLLAIPPSSPVLVSGKKSSIPVLFRFLSDRLSDYPCIPDVLRAAHFLIMTYCSPSMFFQWATEKQDQSSLCLFLNTLIGEVNVQQLPQTTRNLALTILLQVTQWHSTLISTFLSPLAFFNGVLRCVDGERDPRNLLLSFRLIPALITKFSGTLSKENVSHPFEPSAEESFETFACYFPVTFNPPPNDPHGITRADLRTALMNCFTCSASMFAPYAFPFLLDKLSSSMQTTKMEALDHLSACVTAYTAQYAASSIDGSVFLQPYASDWWASIRSEVLKSTSQDVLNACFAATKSLAAAVCQGKEDSSSSMMLMMMDLLRPILLELRSSETRNFTAFGAILQAAATASPTACDIVLTAVGPEIVQQSMEVSAFPRRRALTELAMRCSMALAEVSAASSATCSPALFEKLKKHASALWQLLYFVLTEERSEAAMSLATDKNDSIDMRERACRGCVALATAGSTLLPPASVESLVQTLRTIMVPPSSSAGVQLPPSTVTSAVSSLAASHPSLIQATLINPLMSENDNLSALTCLEVLASSSSSTLSKHIVFGLLSQLQSFLLSLSVSSDSQTKRVTQLAQSLISIISSVSSSNSSSCCGDNSAAGGCCSTPSSSSSSGCCSTPAPASSSGGGCCSSSPAPSPSSSGGGCCSSGSGSKGHSHNGHSHAQPQAAKKPKKSNGGGCGSGAGCCGGGCGSGGKQEPEEEEEEEPVFQVGPGQDASGKQGQVPPPHESSYAIAVCLIDALLRQADASQQAQDKLQAQSISHLLFLAFRSLPVNQQVRLMSIVLSIVVATPASDSLSAFESLSALVSAELPSSSSPSSSSSSHAINNAPGRSTFDVARNLLNGCRQETLSSIISLPSFESAIERLFPSPASTLLWPSLCLFFNKIPSTSPGSSYNTEKVIQHFLQSAFLPTFDCASVLPSTVQCLGWPAKALAMRGHAAGFSICNKLADTLLNPSLSLEISSAASEALCFTIETTDPLLNPSETHARFSPLFKQRFFATICTRLVAHYEKHSSSPASSATASKDALVLSTLARCMQSIPKTILTPEMPRLVPILVAALTPAAIASAGAQAAVSMLETACNSLFSLLAAISPQDAAARTWMSHLSSLIDNLLALSTASGRSPSSSPIAVPEQVRGAALRSLFAASEQLSDAIALRHRGRIVAALVPALDDPRRSVRKEAVKCRNEWISLAS